MSAEPAPGDGAYDVAQVTIRAESLRDDAWVVHVAGELDAATAVVLVEVASQLTRDGTGLRISATDLAFIDSAGLRAFLLIHDRARRCGATVSIVDPSPATRRLLELVGLAEHLLEEQSSGTALRSHWSN